MDFKPAVSGCEIDFMGFSSCGPPSKTVFICFSNTIPFHCCACSSEGNTTTLHRKYCSMITQNSLNQHYSWARCKPFSQAKPHAVENTIPHIFWQSAYSVLPIWSSKQLRGNNSLRPTRFLRLYQPGNLLWPECCVAPAAEIMQSSEKLPKASYCKECERKITIPIFFATSVWLARVSLGICQLCLITSR